MAAHTPHPVILIRTRPLATMQQPYLIGVTHEGALEVLLPLANNVIHRLGHAELVDKLELLLRGKREILHHTNLVGWGDVALADLQKKRGENKLEKFVVVSNETK